MALQAMCPKAVFRRLRATRPNRMRPVVRRCWLDDMRRVWDTPAQHGNRLCRILRYWVEEYDPAQGSKWTTGA